jgi:hypothetical protein
MRALLSVYHKRQVISKNSGLKAIYINVSVYKSFKT